MGKVRRLIAGVRQFDYWLRLGGTLVAILGLLSAILTIIGAHLELVTAALACIIAIVLAGVLNYSKLGVEQVAIKDLVPTDIDRETATFLHCPVDTRLLAEASRLADICFSETVTITPETYEPLFAKNRYIL